MTIVWRLGGCTAAEVVAHIGPPRRLAYTSVATVLKILVRKAMLTSDRSARTHRYEPRISKDDYRRWALHDLCSRLFDGDPCGVVRWMIEHDVIRVGDLLERPQSPIASVKAGNR